MRKPYYYIRFRWWRGVGLEKVIKELSKEFEVKKKNFPEYDVDLSLLKDRRVEVEIKADTLNARLSEFCAILYQKEAKPFTSKDLLLRKKILELYSRNKPTPFPWEFSVEPEFEVQEK